MLRDYHGVCYIFCFGVSVFWAALLKWSGACDLLLYWCLLRLQIRFLFFARAVCDLAIHSMLRAILELIKQGVALCRA